MEVGINVSGFFTTRRLLLLAVLLSLTAAVFRFLWAYHIRSLPQGTIGIVSSRLLKAAGDRT